MSIMAYRKNPQNYCIHLLVPIKPLLVETSSTTTSDGEPGNVTAEGVCCKIASAALFGRLLNHVITGITIDGVIIICATPTSQNVRLQFLNEVAEVMGSFISATNGRKRRKNVQF